MGSDDRHGIEGNGMSAASDNLRNSQEQADFDGTMVRVSRQAIEETLAEYDAMLAALRTIGGVLSNRKQTGHDDELWAAYSGTYIPADTRRYLPDGAQALADIREISNSPDGFIELRRLVDEGTPLLRSHIDRSLAGTIGHLIARYEVCEPLKAFLVAIRARDRQANEIKGAGHSGLL